MSLKIYISKDFYITESDNHLANQNTMFDYIDNIIKPYVRNVINRKDLQLRQNAIVIFDCVRAQITDNFLAKPRQDYLVYTLCHDIEC